MKKILFAVMFLMVSVVSVDAHAQSSGSGSVGATPVACTGVAGGSAPRPATGSTTTPAAGTGATAGAAGP